MMQIKDSLYHKCWEVEQKDKFDKIKIGDSKKKQDGTYEKCTWNGIAVGKAKGMLTKDCKFNIISGQIFSSKGNDGKWYTSVTLFEVEVTEGGQPSYNTDDFAAIENDDSVPF